MGHARVRRRSTRIRRSVADLPGSAGPSQEPNSQPPPPESTVCPNAPARFLLRGESSKGWAARSPAVHGEHPCSGKNKLKSIVFVPFPAPPLSSSGNEDDWTEVKSRKGRRALQKPAGKPRRRPSGRSGRRPAINGDAGHAAFLSRFDGLCFHCLSSSHRRVDCRDPLCCIICKLQGHYRRECPQNPKSRGGTGGSTQSHRPPPQRGPVKERLRFPTPPPSESPPTAMDRQAYLTDPSHRPRTSYKVVVTTPAMEHQEFLLHKHAVLLTASTTQHATSPMGRAIEE